MCNASNFMPDKWAADNNFRERVEEFLGERRSGSLCCGQGTLSASKHQGPPLLVAGDQWLCRGCTEQKLPLDECRMRVCIYGMHVCAMYAPTDCYCLLEVAPCSLKDAFIQELYLHETCLLQCAGACLWGLAVTDTLCPSSCPHTIQCSTYTFLRNSLRTLVHQESKGNHILWG